MMETSAWLFGFHPMTIVDDNLLRQNDQGVIQLSWRGASTPCADQGRAELLNSNESHPFNAVAHSMVQSKAVRRPRRDGYNRNDQ